MAAIRDAAVDIREVSTGVIKSYGQVSSTEIDVGIVMLGITRACMRVASCTPPRKECRGRMEIMQRRTFVGSQVSSAIAGMTVRAVGRRTI